MKLVAVVLVLAVTAFAARNCTPATYACAKNPTTYAEGWQVCDVTGNWVVSLTSVVMSMA